MNTKMVIKLVKGTVATGIGYVCYIAGKKNLLVVAKKINKVGIKKTFMR